MVAVFQIHVGATQGVSSSSNPSKSEAAHKLTHSIAGQSSQKALYIMCASSSHCQDFHFDDIVLIGAVSHTRRQRKRSTKHAMANGVLLGWATWGDGLFWTGRSRRHGHPVHKRHSAHTVLDSVHNSTFMYFCKSLLIRNS